MFFNDTGHLVVSKSLVLILILMELSSFILLFSTVTLIKDNFPAGKHVLALFREEGCRALTPDNEDKVVNHVGVVGVSDDVQALVLLLYILQHQVAHRVELGL